MFGGGPPMKRNLLPFLQVITVGLVLIGCGGGGDSGTSTTPVTSVSDNIVGTYELVGFFVTMNDRVLHDSHDYSSYPLLGTLEIGNNTILYNSNVISCCVLHRTSNIVMQNNQVYNYDVNWNSLQHDSGGMLVYIYNPNSPPSYKDINAEFTFECSGIILNTYDEWEETGTNNLGQLVTMHFKAWGYYEKISDQTTLDTK